MGGKKSSKTVASLYPDSWSPTAKLKFKGQWYLGEPKYTQHKHAISARERVRAPWSKPSLAQRGIQPRPRKRNNGLASGFNLLPTMPTTHAHRSPQEASTELRSHEQTVGKRAATAPSIREQEFETHYRSV